MSIFMWSNSSFVFFFQNSASRPCCFMSICFHEVEWTPAMILLTNFKDWQGCGEPSSVLSTLTPEWNALLQLLSPHLLGFTAKKGRHSPKGFCLPSLDFKRAAWNNKRKSATGTWLCLSISIAAPFWFLLLSCLDGRVCSRPYVMDLSSLLSCGWTRSTSCLTLYPRCEKGRKERQIAVFLHCSARKTIFL